MMDAAYPLWLIALVYLFRTTLEVVGGLAEGP